MTQKPGLILQHGDDGPPARLGEWLQERGIPFVIHHAGEDPPPQPSRFSFVASLGSIHSAAASEPRWIPQEIAALRTAVQADVPVLGLCFGAQALSVALGGGTDVLAKPEIGWFPLDSFDDGVPEGPWLQYHHELMRVPPGARELARSSAGPAVFRRGPHLGVQFHPEVDAPLVERWARADSTLTETGLTAGELVAQSEVYVGAAREQAFGLFDHWRSLDLSGER